MINWKEYKLNELLLNDFDGAWGEDADNGNGVTVLRSTDMRGGKLSFQNAAKRNVSSQILKKKRLIDGDILVNKSSGSAHLVGANVIFFSPDDHDYLCSNFTRCIRPDQTRVDPEFLYFGLQSPQFYSQIFGAQRTTSGLRNLKISEFKAGSLPMPEPLLEQRRIVTRIKECMERVEEIEKLRTSSMVEFSMLLRSYYKDLYEDLITHNPTIPLEKAGTVMGGGTPSKKRDEFWDGTIPWISPREMKRRDLFDAQLHITEEAIARSSTRLIIKPSVLFVVRGMILHHTIPVAVNRVPVTMNQDMKAITPKEDLNVEFLATMIRGAERVLLSKIEVAGHGTRRLQTGHWTSLPIPDISLKKQAEVVLMVQDMERTVDALSKQVNSDEITQLRESILRKAFSGEL